MQILPVKTISRYFFHLLKHKIVFLKLSMDLDMYLVELVELFIEEQVPITFLKLNIWVHLLNQQ